jgi:hypothetical protein
MRGAAAAAAPGTTGDGVPIYNPSTASLRTLDNLHNDQGLRTIRMVEESPKRLPILKTARTGCSRTIHAIVTRSKPRQ